MRLKYHSANLETMSELCHPSSKQNEFYDPIASVLGQLITKPKVLLCLKENCWRFWKEPKNYTELYFGLRQEFIYLELFSYWHDSFVLSIFFYLHIVLNPYPEIKDKKKKIIVAFAWLEIFRGTLFTFVYIIYHVDSHAVQKACYYMIHIIFYCAKA